MMRPSAPERDAESQWAEENEENEEPFSGSFSKKTPPKKTTISDWQNDYTFRLVVALRQAANELYAMDRKEV